MRWQVSHFKQDFNSRLFILCHLCSAQLASCYHCKYTLAACLLLPASRSKTTVPHEAEPSTYERGHNNIWEGFSYCFLSTLQEGSECRVKKCNQRTCVLLGCIPFSQRNSSAPPRRLRVSKEQLGNGIDGVKMCEVNLPAASSCLRWTFLSWFHSQTWSWRCRELKDFLCICCHLTLPWKPSYYWWIQTWYNTGKYEKVKKKKSY